MSEHDTLNDALGECMYDLTHKTASPQAIEQDGKIVLDQEALFSRWIARRAQS